MYADLKFLIERAYRTNGNKKVHIITHSAGGPFTRHFLANFVNKTWKDNFIADFIATNAPFGGSPQALEHAMCQTKWIIPTLSGAETYSLASTLAQAHWLVPSHTVYPENEVMVRVKEKESGTNLHTFTVKNLTELWAVSNRRNISQAVENARKAMNEHTFPQVKMHVLYSTGHKTPRSYVFNVSKTEKKPWWQVNPEVTYGEGDGSVPLSSLTFPKAWKGLFAQYPVVLKEYPGQEHTQIINHPAFLSDVISLVARD
jgi:pimeloyl-ACP methyl ester carboxylesterase